MTYATVSDVQDRISRTLTEDEISICEHLLEDAAAIIDAYNEGADSDAKKVVSCRMTIRALGSGGDPITPIGATQGSMSALGYSQSWTISSGATGELYIGKLEKKLLGIGEKIGSRSPVEDLAWPWKMGGCK